MTELFQFPELKVDREEMVMFRTPFPNHSDEQVKNIMDSFALKGKVEDRGSYILIQDKKSELEIFHASDSVRWAQQVNKSNEVNKKVKLLEENRAIELAQVFLKERNLADISASANSVTYTHTSHVKKGQNVEDFQVALHVNFRFSLDSLLVLGPGAKIQVTFGDNLEIIATYKFWRQPKEDRIMKVISPDIAADKLMKDQAYADLKAGESQVVFHQMRLGYFALPPREAQGFLIPVYAFNGTVKTPYLERYDFTKYVVAVQITIDELKRIGVVFRSPVDIF